MIGLDFGSLSCRGILAGSRDGSVLCEAEYAYPHAIITAPCKDLPGLSEKWCLQDPDDYREALVFVLRELFAKSCVDPEAVAAVGVDATASTVLAVDKECVPLCKKEEYKARIHAWPKMWKHHAAFKEAADLTRAAREFRLPWLDSVGGEIGAEFFVSKVLECFREDRQLFDATDTFLELGDWIVSLLARAGNPQQNVPCLQGHVVRGERLSSGGIFRCGRARLRFGILRQNDRPQSVHLLSR